MWKKNLSEDPNYETNKIVVDDALNLDQPLIISIKTGGVTSYLPDHKTSVKKWENELIHNIMMMTEEPKWNSEDDHFSMLEEAINNLRGQVSNHKAT